MSHLKLLKILNMFGLETKARTVDSGQKKVLSTQHFIERNNTELNIRGVSNEELGRMARQETWRAVRILKKNTIPHTANGIDHRATIPSHDYYFNIWNWDSASAAMGFAHIDPERAYDEARALVAGQDSEGMIPHMVYIRGSKGYWPTPNEWDKENVGEIQTSGITQPPLLAVAIKYIYDHAPNDEHKKEFLKEMLPHLMRYHDFLKKTHDREDSGLLTVFHPWASGEDNSPLWDEPLQRIDNENYPEHIISQDLKDYVTTKRQDNLRGKSSHRPTDEQYYKYIYLVKFGAKRKWDYEKIAEETPFAVKDTTTSSIWAKANDSLADLLDEAIKLETDEEKVLEFKKKVGEYRRYADQTRKALLNTWVIDHKHSGSNPQKPNLMQFCNLDVSSLCAQEIAEGMRKDNRIIEPTSGIFMPFYAGLFNKPINNEEEVNKEEWQYKENMVKHLLDRLDDPEDFGTLYPVASVSFKSNKLDMTRYWRGPVWALINSFIAEGLLSASKNELFSVETKKRAREAGLYIAKSTLKMIAEHGSHETYNPDGPNAEQGLGFKDFSFNESAKITCINLLIEERELPEDFFAKINRKRHFVRRYVTPTIHELFERVHKKGVVYTQNAADMN